MSTEAVLRSLKSVGLSDIRKMVRLMSLLATNKVHSLDFLSKAIAFVISSDREACKLVILMCAQVSFVSLLKVINRS